MTKNRISLYFNFFYLFILMSFITRIILLVMALPDIDLNFVLFFKIFFAGFIYDFVTFLYVFGFLAIYLIFLPEKIYSNKFHKIFIYILFFISSFLLIFNIVSEYYFFYEFGVRYNFIAVDYLVYTTEVIGNIKESYNLKLILPIVTLLSGLTLFLFFKKLSKSFSNKLSFLNRLYFFSPFIILPIFLFFYFNVFNISKNEYANEVALNGIYSLGSAFINNDLPYIKFYKTIEDKKAFEIVRKNLSQTNATFTNDVFSINRKIKAEGKLKKLNLVVVVVESLSAEYLKAFGAVKGENVLSNINNLVDKSLFFNRLYASGTRTVRGLEALTLSIPPLPGTSIIKRPNNSNFFSWGSIMKDLGYKNKFIYGGFGYFDNMNAFFSGNNFDIVDRSNFKKEEISFATIWGVCDGDLFDKVIKEADNDYGEKKPFFYMIMTTSNHRPFTYPEGKIDISPATHSRTGALKYFDYTLGKFISDASKKSWFKDTIFVITADHCANSAGKTEIPVRNYHIPLLVYSPNNIKPKKIDKLMSQIDIGPTILGLLNVSYESKFLGRDIFKIYDKNQAFPSTYQKIGFLKDDFLIVLGPKKYSKTYKYDEKALTTTLVDDNEKLEEEAISFYQTTDYIYRNNLNRL